jgi:hypothetical protein
VTAKETVRWSLMHPAAAALEGIEPFLRWLARQVNIGSRASYRHWQRGPLPRNIVVPPIRAKKVDLVSRPSPVEIKLQHSPP